MGRAEDWDRQPAAEGELHLLLLPILLLLLRHPLGCSSGGSRQSGGGWGAVLRQGSGAADQGGWWLTAGVWETVEVYSEPSAALKTQKIFR